MTEIKSTSQKYKRNFRAIFNLMLTTIVVLNVLYAWALPYVPVECMDDSALIYFKNSEYRIQEDLSIGNTLNVITDAIIIISILKFVLIEGKSKFTYRVLIVVGMKYLMDILFYQRNIYFEGKSGSYFFSIVNNMEKKDSSLFNLGISLLLECFGEIFTGKKTFYKIIVFIHLISFIVYFWLSSRFMTFQILFSVVIYDYLNKY
jgi:hypothetical protein